MGTSQSNFGPDNRSPLVPPWADDQPDQPLPEPIPDRFNVFRRQIGQFIQSGDIGRLESALNHYANSSTGGAEVAVRHFGNFVRVGSSLYRTLSRPNESGSFIDLDSLSGRSCDFVIDEIINALTSNNIYLDKGDSAEIYRAMNYALSTALDGIKTFNADAITDDIIIDTMIYFISESIFTRIVMDAGDKVWNYESERSLQTYIEVIVDKKMAPLFNDNVRSLTSNEIQNLQRDVIISVIKDWGL